MVIITYAKRCSDERCFQRIRRPLRSPGDWLAFEKYSRLVKYIDHDAHEIVDAAGYAQNPYTGCWIPMETYQALRDSRHGTFLPYLRGIHWQQPPAEDRCAAFLHLRMFLGPELRRVSFTVDGRFVRIPTLDTIFDTLQTECPLLETIGLQVADNTSSELSASLCSHFIGYSALRSITCSSNPLRMNDVAKLSTLPALTTMEIVVSPGGDIDLNTLARSQDQPLLSSSSTAWTFATLESLKFTGRLDCVDQLALFLFPRLQCLELMCDSSDVSRLSQPLFATIASNCSHDHLRRIVIRDPRNDGHLVTHPSLAITPPHLRYLLKFRHLHYLKIKACPWMTEYDDTIVMEMASAWPEIEELKLNTAVWRIGWRTASMCATTLSIYVLSQACPSLCWLGILLDARGAKQYEDIALRIEQGRARSSLPQECEMTMLTLGRSPIDDPDRAARVLSWVLPENMLIRQGPNWVTYTEAELNDEEDSEDEVQEALHAQWDQFLELLPGYCSMREEERQRVCRVEQEK